MVAIDELKDSGLVGRMDLGAQVRDFVEDPRFKHIFEEALRTVADREINKLLKLDPKDTVAVVRCQERIKIYGHEFLAELLRLIQDGENAFTEADERGLTEDLKESLK